MKKKVIDRQIQRVVNCPSTHGGAGYAPGSYLDKKDIICGICGDRITNPTPTGTKFILRKGFWNYLFNKGDWTSTWPKWIGKVKRNKTLE